MAPPDMAVARAVSSPNWPVILADQGNNTAGGSPGDGTAILAELKRAGWPDAALFIHDAEAAATAAKAGAGGAFKMAVGAKLDLTSGEPVELDGTVRLVMDGHLIDGHFRAPVELGTTAVVRCGQTDVVLTSRPSTQIHPNYFRAVGIEPRAKHVLVVQSAHLFRDQFEVQERIPKMIIEVDSPGICNPDARRFTYNRLSRPIYPLDEFEWKGPDQARLASAARSPSRV
jgi:microcystin degradation protein MlrC